MNKTIVLFIIIVWTCSCSQYLPYVSRLNSDVKNCKKLENFVVENWSKHKTKHLYKYIEKEKFINEINSNLRSCFFNLSFDQVKQLFGEPNSEIRGDTLIYYVIESCQQKYMKCEVLLISFDNTKLTPVYLSIQHF